MKILFVTSECAPFSKSGGLADVAFSLPPALQAAGNEIAIITPLYRCVKEHYGDQLVFAAAPAVQLGEWKTTCGLYRGDRGGVPVWFVEYNDFFDRPRLYGYDDDARRFAFFSRAVIDLLPCLDFRPDILHCNDWETAPAVLYLKNDQAWRQDLRGIRTVYTIHNIAYQGQFGAAELERTFALPGGWYQGGLGYEYQGRHDINLMKGAILMADAVSTVSATYARELHHPDFGHGLENVMDMVERKTYGILNGIDMDHYDPAIDPRIPYRFTVEDRSGKALCKAAIQRKFSLAEEAEWPLLCSVARLVEQKGIELIRQILPDLMKMGVQLIVFGQGEQKYIDYFNWAKEQWPGQLGFSSDYSEQVASEVFAGADMYLMPSRFEPCGLSQMMAMRYGTVPIVHETGGLKDSVRPYSDFDGIGDGFSFVSYQPKALYLAIQEAVKLYFGDAETFRKLQKRCMTKDFSWTKSAQAYERMYGDIADEGTGGADLAFEEAFARLKPIYEELYGEYLARHGDDLPEDYRRVAQIQILGRGAGVFFLEFRKDGIRVEPTTYHDADAFIAASFDNLVGMTDGTVSADRLFMNGQMKVLGNVSKGAELRRMLQPLSRRKKEE
ncbi:MAG: glycogen/starch synthase [Oscillospiraceae bacterium]|nr:glycogen/starch synthase [Oscillospiraceae bacterium]